MDESEIRANEYHPAADSAMRWYQIWSLDIKKYAMAREAIASSAISGNRLAQIANGTLDRLQNGDPVSDRYLLGLCWLLKEMEQGGTL